MTVNFNLYHKKIYLSVSNAQNLRTSNNFSSIGNRSYLKTLIHWHCVKSVQIRSVLNLSVFSGNAAKYGLEVTPYLDTFHAMW